MLTPFGLAVVGAAALVNLAGFVAFGIDKRRAERGSSRTPEATLVLFAVAGGWVGCWAGVKAFRHKSSKRSFQVKLALGTAASVALLAGSWWSGLATHLPALLA